jgi:hypothetical protein
MIVCFEVTDCRSERVLGVTPQRSAKNPNRRSHEALKFYPVFTQIVAANCYKRSQSGLGRHPECKTGICARFIPDDVVPVVRKPFAHARLRMSPRLVTTPSALIFLRWYGSILLRHRDRTLPRPSR